MNASRRGRMRRRAAAGFSVGVTILAVAGVTAAAAPVDPLAGDARLAQKVKVTAEGVPVEDLLARLAQKCGVSLAASRETADDKVMLFAPARPLHEVLGDLAAL